MEGIADATVSIEADGVSLGSRDVSLLRAIDDHGSLNAASTALGRSFAHAQRRIVDLEEAFGSLVERRRGGAGGGGSTLTERARDLLARYDRLSTEFDGVAEATLSVLPGEVRSRDGELAVIETAAGRLLALAPDGVDPGARVEVSVRSDAVTVELPAESPAPDATSARNRFEGRVTTVENGTTVVVVAVEVTADTTLRALLTRDSLERMSLAVGDCVVVSFKATATRAVAGDS